jgi:hypothetical protein
MKERALLFALLSSIAVTATAQRMAIGTADLPSVHPWAMRNATPSRTGQSGAVGATLGQVDWSFHIAGSVPQLAVAQDGSIYLGSVFNENQWNNEQYAYALTSDGALKWRQKVRPYDWGASQGVANGDGPAVDDAGNVFIPSTYTQLLKMTPDGDQVWAYQGNYQAGIQGAPAVLADQTIRHTIFPDGIAAIDQGGSRLFNANAQNAGATVAVFGNGDMAISGVRTVEPHGSKDIQYFNANGTLRWEKTSTRGAFGTPIFGPDGVVYAPFVAKAFLPDGTVKWTTDVTTQTAALSDTGVLYFAANTTGVVAVLAATGTRLWVAPVTGGVNPDPAIDALGNVFVTTVDGKVWSIAPTGAVNWSVAVCDKFLTGPVIAAGGRLVAAGMTGNQKFVFAVR